MSFVGTRPEAVKYVKKYKAEYMATHVCIPEVNKLMKFLLMS